jgi:hypothetical protein
MDRIRIVLRRDVFDRYLVYEGARSFDTAMSIFACLFVSHDLGVGGDRGSDSGDGRRRDR